MCEVTADQRTGEFGSMAVAPDLMFWLEEPLDWSTGQRQLFLAGWCFAVENEPVVAIQAKIGVRHFSGEFHGDRPDVAAELASLHPPLRCGFAIEIEIPVGQHRLQIRVARRSGEWTKVFERDVTGPRLSYDTERKTATTADQMRAEFGISRHDPTLEFWIDEPVPWTDRVRHLRIAGWCVSVTNTAVQEVRARVGSKTYPGIHGIARPDVAAKFSRENSALHSGFSVDALVPAGRHKLTLEARRDDDRWEAFYERPVRGPLLWRRPGGAEDVGHYSEWIHLYDRLGLADKLQIRQHIHRFAQQPRFSVLLPVYNTEERWLRRAIDSVRGQLYRNWELCIVDDASTARHVPEVLAKYARRDRRITIHRRETNGHISAASNDALRLARGEFVALLDHDDELAPAALYFAAEALNRQPDLQLIYSDEDKLDHRGDRTDPNFKPDWSLDLLRSQNYISHLGIFATETARKVGGFREGFEGAQDHDLTLRVAEAIDPSQIHHIPRVLYHWRQTPQSTSISVAAKPYARTAALRAVQEHLDRSPGGGKVMPGFADFLRVKYPPPADDPLVSIIIPTRDRCALLRQTIESIRAKTTGARFEIIVIDNESREPETLAYLSELARLDGVSVLRQPGEFNFSRLNNHGVTQARGSFLAFLNNDLEVVNDDWLAEMLSHAARPGIGAVGARLWFPDGGLQHGGLLLGVGRVAAPAHRHLTDEGGYFARAQLIQNYSAVTAACLVMRKTTFEEVGGFDEKNLSIAFNDVDLCLRLRERNLQIVWTPYAELIHHESASRGYEDTSAKQERFQREAEYMTQRWGALLQADPFYNPNLSLQRDAQFKLAFPPRLERPWKHR